MDQKQRETVLTFLQVAMNVCGEVKLTRAEHAKLGELYRESVEIIQSIPNTIDQNDLKKSVDLEQSPLKVVDEK